MKTLLIAGAGLLALGSLALADQTAQNQPTDQRLPAGDTSNTGSAQVTATETVSQKPLTPEQRKKLNAAAVRTLNKIADTRFAIRMKNYPQAKSDLEQAETALGQVAELSPTATVRQKVDLARKHLDYQSTGKVIQDLVPVEVGLEEISEYVSTGDAKRHLNQARTSLSRGDKKMASRELKLLGDALVYREVDLPITQTQAQIDKARNDLFTSHPQQADDALKVAESSMPVFETTVVNRAQPSQKQRAPGSNPQ